MESIVSARNIERWEENCITHGCVRLPRSVIGRPKLLAADTIENIYVGVSENPTLHFDEIKEWLAIMTNYGLAHESTRSCSRT